jgi:hypothetical protein
MVVSYYLCLHAWFPAAEGCIEIGVVVLVSYVLSPSSSAQAQHSMLGVAPSNFVEQQQASFSNARRSPGKRPGPPALHWRLPELVVYQRPPLTAGRAPSIGISHGIHNTYVALFCCFIGAGPVRGGRDVAMRSHPKTTSHSALLSTRCLWLDKLWNRTRKMFDVTLSLLDFGLYEQAHVVL